MPHSLREDSENEAKDNQPLPEKDLARLHSGPDVISWEFKKKKKLNPPAGWNVNVQFSTNHER